MSDSSEHPEIPSRLAEDLAAAYRSPVVVPAQVNDAILNRARAQFARRRPRHALRWVGAAAAAACVVLAARVALFQAPLSPDDIDGNRRVDIVDALKLARQVESGNGRDLNGDGTIDRRDVDTIVLAVVRLDGGVR